KVAIPKGWKKSFGRNPDFQLILEKEEDVIFVSGLENLANPEEILEETLNEQKQAAKVKELRRDKIKVGGVEATLVRQDLTARNLTRDVWITVFKDQGIVYRIFGVSPKNKSSTLEADYQALLKSFTILGERKDWLAQLEGKPARTAFLGGLAS